MNSTLLTLFGVGLAFILWHCGQFSSSGESALPGPPRLPLLGNLLQVPVHQPWVRFAEWKKLYGDVIALKIFGRHLFVLNSRAAAVELFEKRSAIYSERPRRQMADLCGFGKALLFQKYGNVARKTRKFMHAEISQNCVHKHGELQEREVTEFIQRILSSSETLLADSRRLAASVILMISYGYQVSGPSDPLVSLAEQVMGYVEKVITPNNFLVDSLPILRHIPDWFPWAQFKLEAKKCRNLLHRLMNEPYVMVRNQMQNGLAIPSLVSRNLEGRLDTINEDEDDILMWTAGGLYAGGSHSTVAIIMSFFLCMLLHPDIQERAQAELKPILDEGRLPNLADKASLPYIECILQEILRWRPVAPLALLWMMNTKAFLSQQVRSLWQMPGRLLTMKKSTENLNDSIQIVSSFPESQIPVRWFLDLAGGVVLVYTWLIIFCGW